MKKLIAIGCLLLVSLGVLASNTTLSKNADTRPPDPSFVISYN